MIYVYDFGDNWVHEVILEALLLPQKGRLYSVIEKGRRACPPEDVGGDFDADVYDVEAASLALRRGLTR